MLPGLNLLPGENLHSGANCAHEQRFFCICLCVLVVVFCCCFFSLIAVLSPRTKAKIMSGRTQLTLPHGSWASLPNN